MISAHVRDSSVYNLRSNTQAFGLTSYYDLDIHQQNLDRYINWDEIISLAKHYCYKNILIGPMSYPLWSCMILYRHNNHNRPVPYEYCFSSQSL